MTRLLYLHFGPHKTGTTSIQHYLKRNRDALAGKGISVFHNVRLADDRLAGHQQGTNCHQIAHLILRPELETIARRHDRVVQPDPQAIGGILDEINAQLHRCPTDDVVVSSETFSFLRTDAERAALDRLADGFALRPVCFFRDRTAWMESWRRQVTDNISARLLKTDPAGTIFDFSERSWLLDHDALRRFFGPDGQYLSYEKALEKHGSVIPDFLTSLGLEPGSLPKADRIWLNTTEADAPKPVAAARPRKRERHL